MMAWCYHAANPATNLYTNFFAQENKVGVSVSDSSGTVRWNLGTATTDNVGASTPTTATWYHLCMTVSGTDCAFYVNGAVEASGTNPDGNSTQIIIGGFSIGDTSPNNQANCRIVGFKAWNFPMNRSQILAERNSIYPVCRQNLAAVIPCRHKNDVWNLDGSAGSRSCSYTVSGVVQATAGTISTANNYGLVSWQKPYSRPKYNVQAIAGNSQGLLMASFL